MDLSGSIQVISGTCGMHDILVFRGETPFQDIWIERNANRVAKNLFAAEVLRIKAEEQ